MTSKHVAAILMLLSLSCLTVTLLHARDPEKETDFVINPNRPFVYLEFDHVGPGIPRSENEPISRIWFRLTNNSRVPITVRTYGVPDGSPKYEIGVMYKVLRDEPVQGGLILLFAPSNIESGKEKEEPTPTGYMFHVGSFQSMAPGDQVLLSVPANHLNKRWHLEIPFEFDLPTEKAGKESQNINVGGIPKMIIAYSIWDLPAKAQVEIGGK